MIIINDIELCFWKPERELPPGGVRGVLYLLRRDLLNQYGAESEIPSPTNHSPMLATIGMMTGLEHMAKLATNDFRGSRSVLKNFLGDFGGLGEEDREALYRLRCAQVHAYCLVDFDEKAIFRFELDDNAPKGSPLLSLGDGQKDPAGRTAKNVWVNYWELKRFFLSSLANFERAVRYPQGALINNFMNAMAVIGKIQIKGK